MGKTVGSLHITPFEDCTTIFVSYLIPKLSITIILP